MGAIGMMAGIVLALCIDSVWGFYWTGADYLTLTVSLACVGYGCGKVWQVFFHERFIQWRFMRAVKGR